jgi:hypothetical protein
VAFRAVDSFSPVARAQYSVDAADWQFVAPVDQLSDAKTETYDFRIPLPSAPGAKSGTGGEIEHVVVVRAYDRYENMGSAKTVIAPK